MLSSSLEKKNIAFKQQSQRHQCWFWLSLLYKTHQTSIRIHGKKVGLHAATQKAKASTECIYIQV